MSYPECIADVLGFGATKFEIETIKAWQCETQASGTPLNPWAPFVDEEEWQLVEWLMTEMTQKAQDKFLKLLIAGVI